MQNVETKRLILRKLNINDLNDFHAYCKKTNIGPMAGWSPHLSVAESEFILRDMIIKDEVMAIVYKENNKLIGTLGFHPYKDIENAREVGFVLDDLYWGKGLMVEVCKEAFKEIFSDNILELYCGHFAHNFRSRRVIEKLGFRLYKIDTDDRFKTYTDKVYLYQMNKEDYLGEENEWI